MFSRRPKVHPRLPCRQPVHDPSVQLKTKFSSQCTLHIWMRLKCQTLADLKCVAVRQTEEHLINGFGCAGMLA